MVGAVSLADRIVVVLLVASVQPMKATATLPTALCVGPPARVT